MRTILPRVTEMGRLHRSEAGIPLAQQVLMTRSTTRCLRRIAALAAVASLLWTAGTVGAAGARCDRAKAMPCCQQTSMSSGMDCCGKALGPAETTVVAIPSDRQPNLPVPPAVAAPSRADRFTASSSTPPVRGHRLVPSTILRI
jgi:hypothetical protein